MILFLFFVFVFQKERNREIRIQQNEATQKFATLANQQQSFPILITKKLAKIYTYLQQEPNLLKSQILIPSIMKQDNITLSIQALSRFNAKFKPPQSTAMKSVVAALYLAQSDGILKYTNMIGLLQLDQDRKLKTKCLRMYNMETMRLAFQVELYYDFANHYQKLDDKFYYFDYPVGSVGLLFRNKEEADIMALKIKSQAPTMKDSQQFIDQIKAKQKTKQQANSLFGIFKRKVLGKEEVIQESSEIHQFKKICNMKIDAEGRFNTQGESPFHVDIIQRLGLSEKQKKNPQIMNMIANDLLIHQLKKQVIQNPKPQIIQFIQQHQKQQTQYLEQIQQTKLLNIPPPPPPPPLLHPQNRISMARMTNNRANLMDQIRNNKLQLKHVKTNQKGGLNIDMSAMDNNDRDDFASAMRKKIAMRKRALNKYKDSDEESD